VVVQGESSLLSGTTTEYPEGVSLVCCRTVYLPCLTQEAGRDELVQHARLAFVLGTCKPGQLSATT